MESFLAQFDDSVTKIAILLISTIVVTTILYFIVIAILRLLLTKQTSQAAVFSVNKFKRPTFFFLFIITSALLHSAFSVDVVMSNAFVKAYIVAFIISLTWFAINGIKIAKRLILLKYDINMEDNLEARKVETQLRVFERVLITVILIVAIASILMSFEEIRKFGINLLASAGIAGIIIGLAAQKSISNIIAGIQLALTQPMRIDDVLIVENEWGRVEEINLTYVVLRIWDQRRLIIPLSYFIDKPFQNWTRNNAEILGTVFLYVDYTVDVDLIRTELDKILKQTPLWDKRVGIVQVTNTTEKTMEVRVLVSAKDSPTAFDLRVLIREKLIVFLQNKYPNALPKIRIEKTV